MSNDDLTEAAARLSKYAHKLSISGLVVYMRLASLDHDAFDVISGGLGGHARVRLEAALRDLVSALRKIPHIHATDLELSLQIKSNEAVLSLTLCQSFVWVTGADPSATSGIVHMIPKLRDRLAAIDAPVGADDEIRSYTVRRTSDNDHTVTYQIRAKSAREAACVLECTRRQFEEPDMSLSAFISIKETIPERLWKRPQDS